MSESSKTEPELLCSPAGDETDSALANETDPHSTPSLPFVERRASIAVEFASPVLDALSSHLAILDETGAIVATNKAWNDFALANDAVDGVKLCGIGVNYLRLCEGATGECAEDAFAMGRGLRAVLEGNLAEFAHEYPCHAPHERRWFMGRVTRFEHNSRRYLVVAHENITLRKLAEEALRESEMRFRIVADTAPVMLWETDTEARCVFLNRGWYEFTGQTEAEALGLGWVNAVHPEDRDHAVHIFLNASHNKADFALDYRLRRHDGVYRWAVDAGRPHFDKNDEYLGYIGSVSDIHDRKEAEAKLRRQQTELEALNVLLRRAMIETHHRVKNNLQVISAVAEIQAYDGRTSTMEALARVSQHTRSLALLHDLLTQQSKDSDSGWNTVGTRAVIGRLVPLLQSSLGERSLKSHVEDTEITVKAGAGLSLLVSELVSNAGKHGRGEIEVTLNIEGKQARLEVTDQGQGFSDDFDPLLSANTGLELILSVARVDLQGDIQFQNRVGGGAQVIVTFSPLTLPA